MTVTALFLPLYERMLEYGWYRRLLLVGAAVLTLLLVLNALSLMRLPKRRMSLIWLVGVSVTAALIVEFASLERTVGRVQPFDGTSPTICARVLEWDRTDYGSKYLIETLDNESFPNHLRARLYTYQEQAAEAGDIIQITAPVTADIQNYDKSRGIYFYVFGGEAAVECIRSQELLRDRIIEETQTLYDDPVLGIVEGVLFGEKGNIEEPIRQMMTDAGLVHLLAVSGIHISLMGAFCGKLFSFVRIPKRFAALLSLGPVWGYIALAQFSPSAVRAGIMATMYTLGMLLQREGDTLAALCTAAIAVLAVSPYSLYSISFQLSFLITLGIILCTGPIAQVLLTTGPVDWLMGRGGERMEKLLRTLCSTAAASLAATVFSMPVMLYHFQYTAIWGVLAAELALWAAAPLMVFAVLSVLFALLHSLSGWLVFLLVARVAAGFAGIFARWILLVSKAISSLPGALFYSHDISMMLCGGVLVALLLLAVYKWKGLSNAAKRRRMACFVSCSVFCLCITMTAETLSDKGMLTIFSTENALVLTRDGQGALIGDVCDEYEAQDVLSILRCEGVERLELVLCTSEDTDESVGLDMVVEQMHPKMVAVEPKGTMYAHILEAMDGAEPVLPQSLYAQLLGGVTIQMLDESVQIEAGGKKLLKTGQRCDIIDQGGSEVRRVYLLPEQSALKINMDGKAGTQG